MNRLIKAEAFSFKRVAYFGTAYVSFLAFLFFSPFMDLELLNYTFAESLAGVGGSLAGFVLMILPVFFALWIASGYNKRTAYYEVMAGSKISHILGSKIIFNSVFLGLIFLLATFSMSIILLFMNGMGQIEQLGLRMFLLLVTYFHMTIVAVLMSMAIRQSFLGAVVVYFRFYLLEGVIIIIMGALFQHEYVSEEFCRVVLEQLFQDKFYNVLLDCITPRLFWEVVLGFALEVVLWYSIAYTTMKKRLYT